MYLGMPQDRGWSHPNGTGVKTLTEPGVTWEREQLRAWSETGQNTSNRNFIHFN